jgi:hypothetical protein
MGAAVCMKEYGLQVRYNKWWFISYIFKNYFLLVYSYIFILERKCKYVAIELTAVSLGSLVCCGSPPGRRLGNDFEGLGVIVLAVVT